MGVLKLLIDIVVPSALAYLASDVAVIDWLNANVLSQSINADSFRRACLILIILYSTLALNGRLYFHIARERQCYKEVEGMYNVVKQFAQSSFAEISGDPNFSFDMRIFVPEMSVLRKAFHKGEKWFTIRNIEPFARKDVTEHLRFRVEPDRQGLVGDAYHTGSVVYDEDLSTTNATDYSLETSQLSRTSGLLWSICVPISNDANEVIAVVAFDSDRSQLSIRHNAQKISNLTNTLAIMMHDSVPELFKRKWRI